MDQRISFVTLAVADLTATRRFYLDGLGWTAELEVPGEVLMIRVGEHLVRQQPLLHVFSVNEMAFALVLARALQHAAVRGVNRDAGGLNVH